MGFDLCQMRNAVSHRLAREQGSQGVSWRGTSARRLTETAPRHPTAYGRFRTIW